MVIFRRVFTCHPPLQTKPYKVTRGGYRAISVGFRFDQITVFTLRIRTDSFVGSEKDKLTHERRCM